MSLIYELSILGDVPKFQGLPNRVNSKSIRCRRGQTIDTSSKRQGRYPAQYPGRYPGQHPVLARHLTTLSGNWTTANPIDRSRGAQPRARQSTDISKREGQIARSTHNTISEADLKLTVSSNGDPECEVGSRFQNIAK